MSDSNEGRVLLTINILILRNISMSANGCGFNRSMQHLISNDREEDVENEAATKDLLHRRTKGVDVGSLEER